jgi:hypothetical protein
MSQKNRILTATTLTMTGSNVEVALATLLVNDRRQNGVNVLISNTSGAAVQARANAGTVGISIPDGQTLLLEDHDVSDGILYLNGASGDVLVTLYGPTNPSVG